MPFLLILLLTFLFSQFGTFLTIQVARQQQLVEATNHRKFHSEKVAAVGGIPIFITLVIFYIVKTKDLAAFSPILLAAFCLLGIGLWDDLKPVGIKRRLLIQFFAANIAYFTGFKFQLEILALAEIGNYLLTVGFIGMLINGTNFLDGINGLAGGLGVIAMLIFSTIFYQASAIEYAGLSLIYAGALLGFLRFNYGKKAAIFMGDNGSTVLGFLLAVFALKVWSFSGQSSFNTGLINSSLCLIALPILDLIGVVSIRLFNKQSPFKADRRHIHHLLIDQGKTHPEACQLIFGWLLGLIMLCYLLTGLSLTIGLITGSYLMIRILFSNAKLPAISPAKWDKPVPQQT